MARPAVAADRARTDHNAELEELAADTLGAPERVLVGHGGDQLPDLRTQSGSAQVVARAPAPVEPPASSMPANDGLGTDQDQMPFPVRVEAPDHQPEEPVSGLESRARTGTERDMELVAQEQVLNYKLVPSAKEPGQCGDEAAD
jgi:hypothetical protein